jgi:uncharacterized protein (DUF433 family)
VKTDELIDHYVEPDPLDRGVEEARIKKVGVPIWALIGHMRAIDGGVDEVAFDYDLPKEAVKAAFGYYKRHRHAIDARIAANALD